MKRRGKVALLLGIMGVISMFFSGCRGLLNLNTDDEKVDAAFDQLLNAVVASDAEAVEALFAKNVVSEGEGFEQDLSELFSFCRGEVVSCNDRSGRCTSIEKNGSKYIKEIDTTHDVKTTEGLYRFAMKYRVADSKEPQNIGIRSLYVTECDNEESLYFAYWGDGNWEIGITIEPKEGTA